MQPPFPTAPLSARLSDHRSNHFTFHHRVVVVAMVLLVALFSVLVRNRVTEAVAPNFAAKQDFATATGARSVAVGDFNGDGKLDLASANDGANSVSVLLNTTVTGAATPSFAAKQDFATGNNPFSVAAADLNGDGRLDLAVANNGGGNAVSVLLNTTAPGAAMPSFAAKQDFGTGSLPAAVAIGDLNGDGKPDLAVGNSGALVNTISVLLNTTAPGSSTASFLAKQDFGTASTPLSVKLADLNGDGKPDLITTNLDTNNVSVLLNTTAPGSATAGFAAKQDFATGNAPRSVAVGDLNGDGKLDLATANSGVGINTASVLFNTTAPGATTASFAAKQDFDTGSGPQSVALGDVNGDGKLDLVAGNTDSNTVTVLRNTAAPGATTPSFATKADFATGTGPTSVALGDVNGDGKLDLAAANNTSNNLSVLVNTTDPGPATPGFLPLQSFGTGGCPFSVTSGDLNGDGHIDLAMANFCDSTVSVLLNTTAAGAATSSFAAKQDFNTTSSPQFVTMGDVNGDGKLDLVVPSLNTATVSVLLNTTAPGAAIPSFAAKQDFATLSGSRSVALADLNGDGLLDLAVLSQTSVSVLLNTTPPGAVTPSFATKQDFTTGSGGMSVAAGDVNGDGLLDLAAANFSDNNVSVLLNTTAPGATTFSFAPKQDFGMGASPFVVALSDFNGDGRLDLAVLTNAGASVSVLLNTTAPGAVTPSFATKQDFAAGGSPQGLAAGDLNGDGRLDLLAVNFSDNLSVLVNSTAPGVTTPSFAAKMDFPTTSNSNQRGGTLGDINGDGKLDLIVVDALHNNVSVLLNTPTIVPATGLSRQQGSAASNSQIATTTNYGGNGSVAVTIASANPSNGVTISNIVNTNGNVTADIVAACAATNATFTLQASDGSSTVTATLTIPVTANTAPTLTYSTPQSVAFNGSLNVSPTTATDNGSIASYAVQSVSPAMTTAPTVNASGVVSITNAQPAGSHVITIRATDNCGATTDAAFTLNVSKGNQTITVGTHAPANATHNTSFTVAATSSSGLPVSYGSAGVCTNVGPTFTMTSGTGTCTVRYDQFGDGNFNGAPQVTESVTAQKANQTINVGTHAPANATFNSSFTVAATSNSGLAIAYSSAGVCTNVGATFTMTSGGGTCTVKYDQTGDTNFNGAPQVTESVTAQKANQTINVGTHAPANATFNTSFTVAATSNSALAVAYSSAGVCTNVGATFTMTSGTGTCTVRYDQVGDSNFNGAPQVTEPVTAQKASTTTGVTSSINPSMFGQNVSFIATVTSAAGTPAGTVQFKFDGVNLGSPVTLSGSGTAQLSTNTLSAGTHTVAADYSGNTNFVVSTGTLSGGQVVNQALISLSASTYSASESSGLVAITVLRNNLTTTAVSIDYITSADNGIPCSTATGVATPKCDFTTAQGTLIFAAGETNKTIIVPLTQDSFVEGPETFSLTLSNPMGGAGLVNPKTASITITDDPTEPTTNPIDDAGNFVRQHYHDFLNREPDPIGWDFWTNQITSCGSDVQCNEVRRISVSASFFLSIEFQQTGYLVERFYKVGYGDATGTSSFVNQHQLPVPIVRVNEFLTDTQRIGRGVVVLAPGWEQLLESNKQAYTLEFVLTSRFATAFPTTMTPAEFVDKLNQNAGLVLSPTERTTAINLFGGAPNSTNLTARAVAVRQVAEDQDLYNAEFNRAFVLAEYFGYLRRNPNDAPESTLDYTGYDFWLTKLNQFNGNYINAEMVKAFLASIEYRQRFGP